MDLSIIVPCYNEVENIPKIEQELFPVIRELAQSQSVQVVFVDDGSSDGTWQGLQEAFGNENGSSVTVCFEQHKVNQGLGAALRTGFAASRGERVVTTDSDGTYKFAEIPNLLACLTPGVDMVTASPYHPQGGVAGVPAYRLFFSRGCSAVYRILADWRVYTYTCLFRAYRRAVIDQVSFESNGFLAGTEILVNGMLMGFRAAEYPAVLHQRVYGTSKAKLVRTIRAHLKYQWRVLLHRLHIKSIQVRKGKQV
jgi:dolichol-phosphate mannosyltransferase